MKKTIFYFTLLILGACKKDKNPVEIPPPTNQEESITTMIILLKDTLGIKPGVSATFRDPDGSGPATYTQFDTIKLSENTTYLAELILLDETKSPSDTISQEVLAEDDQHLFCFTPSGLNINIIRSDSDGNYEVGLKSKWTCGVAGTGNIKITLKHQPDIKNGTCDVGETDLEINFPTMIFP